jgi:predicted  nucleic acid-binding Zn-ribbon protein
MEAAFRPTVLESVRCLECGEIYAKPLDGGTIQMNPGCPVCSYVGWIPLTLPGDEPRRSAGDRHRPRLVRAR